VEPEDDPVVHGYLQRAKAAPLLTKDEESRLSHLAMDGDPAARTALVDAHLRLVVAIARRYARERPAPQLADLLGLGEQGLQAATLKFDASKGVRFSTVATWWIRQAISRGLPGGPDGAGVREPRQPRPPSGSSAITADFAPGDEVKVMAGPFTDFVGRVIDTSDPEGPITVVITICGRPTAVLVSVEELRRV
jgi:hypothetical protein